MGTFTGNTVASGNVIYASDHNTLVGLLSTVLNGGIDNANIAASAGIDFSKISGGSSTALGAPVTYTPVWTNMTVASSTVSAKYIQIGKIVYYYISVILAGGNKPTGAVSFTLPVTSISYPGTATAQNIGSGSYYDNGALTYDAAIVWASTTTATILAKPANGTWVSLTNVSGSDPHAWANTDEIFLTGWYFAA